MRKGARRTSGSVRPPGCVHALPAAAEHVPAEAFYAIARSVVTRGDARRNHAPGHSCASTDITAGPPRRTATARHARPAPASAAAGANTTSRQARPGSTRAHRHPRADTVTAPVSPFRTQTAIPRQHQIGGRSAGLYAAGAASSSYASSAGPGPPTRRRHGRPGIGGFGASGTHAVKGTRAATAGESRRPPREAGRVIPGCPGRLRPNSGIRSRSRPVRTGQRVGGGRNPHRNRSGGHDENPDGGGSLPPAHAYLIHFRCSVSRSGNRTLQSSTVATV